ncbi:hypothetical protein C6P64_14460 [Malikia granosa]|uniref:Abi-like protein n=2 Tax=Malikia granosa TaxID=263067 RepID=A0A2S9K1V4_9BURK|nr:hypothetical protein C6P64_14460 [Malikia granosa]
MSMVLLSLMSTFEVALRNRIHRSLSRQATEKMGPASDSFAWYDQQLGMHKLEGETFTKVEAILSDDQKIRLKVQPSPDSVIARLPFGVWPNILDQQLPTPVIEARTFKDVFPHHPRAKNHWNHGDNRKTVVNTLKDVRAWRNRLAHCKPVWSAGWYRSSTTQHWGEVLDRVKSRRAGMLEVLGWICPKTLEVYNRSFSSRLFNELVTEHAVMAHIFRPLELHTGPISPCVDPVELIGYKARR